jgi:hypothetical protein
MIRFATFAALAALMVCAAPATAGAAVNLGWQDEHAIASAEHAPAAFAAAHAIHARSMRLIIRWDRVQPQRGVYDWAAIDDSTFRGFVQAVARRYGRQVATWSVLNEVDLVGYPARRYSRMFAGSRRIIRRESPGARVLFGEFSAVSALSYTRAALAGHHVVADGFAIHPYPMARSASTQADITRLGTVDKRLAAWRRSRALRTPGGRAAPMFATEYGCQAQRYTENMCADQWRLGMRVARKYDLRQVVAYQMLASGRSAGWDTGLVRENGSPRLALAAVAGRSS